MSTEEAGFKKGFKTKTIIIKISSLLKMKSSIFLTTFSCSYFFRYTNMVYAAIKTQVVTLNIEIYEIYAAFYGKG